MQYQSRICLGSNTHLLIDISILLMKVLEKLYHTRTTDTKVCLYIWKFSMSTYHMILRVKYFWEYSIMLGFTLKALIDSMRLRFTLNFKTDEELNSNAKWIQVVDQRYATWIVAATTTICKNILKKKNSLLKQKVAKCCCCCCQYQTFQKDQTCLCIIMKMKVESEKRQKIKLQKA